MPVDLMAPPRIIVAHGVELGTSADQKQFKDIEDLVTRALNAHGLQKEFASVQFPYEDINDKAQTVAALVLRALTAEIPLADSLVSMVVDIVGDVAGAMGNTGVAREIKGELRKMILSGYQEGRPQLLMAHSLGTIYALDVVCELMAENEFFQGDDRTTWPVCGLLTMGSPLGLHLFRRDSVTMLRDHDFTAFRWENYWNRLDPVVSGHVFGRPMQATSDFLGPVERRFKGTKNQGWNLQPNVTVSGKQWVMAHGAYWRDPKIADEILQMLWS